MNCVDLVYKLDPALTEPRHARDNYTAEAVDRRQGETPQDRARSWGASHRSQGKEYDRLQK